MELRTDPVSSSSADHGDGDGAAADGGGGDGGWPLGLRLRPRFLHHHHYRNSPLFLSSTTSISISSQSSSSSDLDTESTASFFHDRRTSLGTLIGIRERAPQRSGLMATDGERGGEPMVMQENSERQRQQQQGAMAMAMAKKKRARGGGEEEEAEAEMGMLRCMFVLCGKGRGASSSEEAGEALKQLTSSPSLAHYLEMERKHGGGDGGDMAAMAMVQDHRRSRRADVMLQKPLASYLSIDWIPIAHHY